MRKTLFVALGGLFGLVVLVLIIGAALGEKHEVTRRGLFTRTPEVIFNAIVDVRSYPGWRRGLSKVERLADLDGKEVWREHYSGGESLDLLTEEKTPPRKIVRRIVGEDLPFGGYWEFLIQPVKTDAGRRRASPSPSAARSTTSWLGSSSGSSWIPPRTSSSTSRASEISSARTRSRPRATSSSSSSRRPRNRRRPRPRPTTTPTSVGTGYACSCRATGSYPSSCTSRLPLCESGDLQRPREDRDRVGGALRRRRGPLPPLRLGAHGHGFDGSHWTGTFELTRRGGERANIPFKATKVAYTPHRAINRFPVGQDPSVTEIGGSWRVDFERSGRAKAIFEQAAEVTVGTVLTTTGDYRYLAGVSRGGKLQLSVFDGSHAFLFEAGISKDGKRMEGEFLSGNHWQEKFTAVRSDEVELPSPLSETKLRPGKTRLGLDFLQRPAYRGRPIVINLFGSWCPNCHDEAPLLQALYEKYRDSGLDVIGLAYEHTEDEVRSKDQVNAFRKRTGIGYDTIVVGVSDKEKAATTLPELDSIKAFPTTIFLNRDHTVRAIHTGFSGPATGAAHEETKALFEKLAKEIVESKAG